MNTPIVSPTIVEGTPEEIAAVVSGLPRKRYHVEIRDLNGSVSDQDSLDEAVREALARTPEQILSDREQVLAGSRRPMPIPPGKTLDDVVKGKWPGDETDEEIRAALEEIS